MANNILRHGYWGIFLTLYPAADSYVVPKRTSNQNINTLTFTKNNNMLELNITDEMSFNGVFSNPHETIVLEGDMTDVQFMTDLGDMLDQHFKK